jgi:hypothetical protein
MKAMAGAGALLTQGHELPVAYDFVQCPATSRWTAEGEVFGDAQSLVDAYNAGPCDLRLESGRLAKIVLVSCHLHGAAEARIASPLDWG